MKKKRMKKTKLIKPIGIRSIIFLAFQMPLFTFLNSCGTYSAYNHVSGNVTKDIKDKEDKIKIDTENKLKDDAKAQLKIVTENKLKAFENEILVEGSTFQMGGDGKYDGNPARSVTVSSFYIGKYETSQAEYQAIMGNNPSIFKGSASTSSATLPVEKVSWWDAIKYCNAKSKKEGLAVAYNENTGWLLDSNGYSTSDVTKVKGYRLPTEVEWEYSARGGNKSRGYTYAGSNNLDDVAVYEKIPNEKESGSAEYGTHTSGSKAPNELGIYDMSGNVWEWCTDSYNISDNGTTINPNIERLDLRVLRGGSWGGGTYGLSVVDRNLLTPNYSYANIGFRTLRTP